MALIKTFQIDGQNIVPLNSQPVVSGTFNFVTFRFIFPNSWQNLTKFCLFTRDTNTYEMLIDNDKLTCKVPYEVCAAPGEFTFSVAGVRDKNKVVATTNTLVQVVQGSLEKAIAEEQRITPTLLVTALQEVVAGVEEVNDVVGEIGNMQALEERIVTLDRDIDDVEQRVTELEDRPTEPQDYEELKAQVNSNSVVILAKADKLDVIGLEDRVQALEDMPPQEVDLSPIEERLDALENRPSGEPEDYEEVKGQVDTNKENISTLTWKLGTIAADLSGKADKSEIIKSFNELEDKPYIPSLDGYATELYVQNAVVGKADSSTILTIQDTISTIQGTLSDKANRSEIITSYNDLTDKPDIPSIESSVNELSGRVSSNESDINALKGSIKGLPDRVTALEGQLEGLEQLLSEV